MQTGGLWVRHLGSSEIDQDWRVWWVYWVLCWVVFGDMQYKPHHRSSFFTHSGMQRRESEEAGLLLNPATPALCGFILKALKTAALQFRQHFPGMIC